MARFQFLSHAFGHELDDTAELVLPKEHHHPEEGHSDIGRVEVHRISGILQGKLDPGLPCFAQSQRMLVCGIQLRTQLELIEVEQFQVEHQQCTFDFGQCAPLVPATLPGMEGCSSFQRRPLQIQSWSQPPQRHDTSAGQQARVA